jgi:hypothetical protein
MLQSAEKHKAATLYGTSVVTCPFKVLQLLKCASRRKSGDLRLSVSLKLVAGLEGGIVS